MNELKWENKTLRQEKEEIKIQMKSMEMRMYLMKIIYENSENEYEENQCNDGSENFTER